MSEDTAGVGHNSGDILNQAAQKEIRSLVERLENLDREAAEIREFRKEVKAEAKGRGFDVKQLDRLVKARKIDRAKGLEARAILELYAEALGDPTLAELI